jgi:hypothetical protein
MIEAGARVTQACKQALVSYAGFRNHVARNPLYQKRLRKAEKVRDEVWRDFALEMVKAAMPKNWAAALTYLERTDPLHFALRAVSRPEPTEQQPIGDKIPQERLEEYGREMLQFAREEEARKLAHSQGGSLAGEPPALPDTSSEAAG